MQGVNGRLLGESDGREYEEAGRGLLRTRRFSILTPGDLPLPVRPPGRSSPAHLSEAGRATDRQVREPGELGAVRVEDVPAIDHDRIGD